MNIHETLNVFHSFDRSIVASFIAEGHAVEARFDKNGTRRVRIDGRRETSMNVAMDRIARWAEGATSRNHFIGA